MHRGLKHALKAVTPPILADLVRKPPKDMWAHVGPDLDASFIELVSGPRFHLRPTHEDREVCKQVFFQEDYDLRHTGHTDALMAFYGSAERPIIVDAGANIGAASVWFGDRFQKAAVVAVEPDPGNLRVLRKNVERLPSVIPLQAAIASKPGNLVLTDPGGGAWAFRTSSDPGARGEVVEAMTIEQILACAGAGTPFILKIDIEGAEVDLFSRFAEDFDRFPLIIIEFHDWMLPGEASCRNFLRWQSSVDRDFMFHGENVYSVSHALFP